jgi:predicted flap endonuclease-1-like 5' DNA nuclease
MTMSHPISTIREIDEDEVAALKSAGIKTTERLLEAAKSPQGRKQLAARSELDPKKLLRWANMADKLRIKGMGNDYATLLRETGVDTVRELGYRNPRRLAQSMRETNKKKKLVRFLPPEKLVTRWIEQARRLQKKITY